MIITSLTHPPSPEARCPAMPAFYIDRDPKFGPSEWSQWKMEQRALYGNPNPPARRLRGAQNGRLIYADGDENGEFEDQVSLLHLRPKADVLVTESADKSTEF
jgi:hypothetical protein